MGFLSRKPKAKKIEVEEQHPIVEELQRMEEAVPERPATAELTDEYAFELQPQEGRAPRATGPVADEDASSSQAAGEAPSSAPPVAEAPVAPAVAASAESAVGGESPAPSVQVKESEPEAQTEEGSG